MKGRANARLMSSSGCAAPCYHSWLMRGVSIIVFVVAAGAGGGLNAAPPPADDPRALVVAGLAAYQKGDFVEYLSDFKQAAVLRPTHPVILYRLAGAHALNGQAQEAAATLRRLARLEIYCDPARDPDFARVTGHSAVQEAIRAVGQVRSHRIGASAAAFTIADPSFIPEGVAFDKATSSFFVSSQYKRKIVRVDAHGVVSDFVTEAQDGLWMVFGIVIDPARRWLWAVSTAEPSMRGFSKADEKRAGLFAFDLVSKRLTKRILMDPAEPAHYFDDLTVAADGRVFVSDAGTGTVYTLARDAEQLTVLVPPGTIQGPNGLALTPDGSRLFVSDYAGFIVSVDATSGAAVRLPAPADAVLYGIDGLAWLDDGLIGVQNGVDPPRVIRLRLSPDRSAVDRVEVIEMNNPLMREPTLGVVADGGFYFVADSQGQVLRKTTNLEKEELRPPVILRAPLDGPGLLAGEH
jgi:sugar lactone lactonase YvrE